MHDKVNQSSSEAVEHVVDTCHVEKSSPERVSPLVDEEAEVTRVSVRAVIAIFALACVYEAALFSFILPANILVSINKDIGPSNNYAWIALAWTLACSVSQTTMGRISDIFGRRYVLQFGNSLSLIGCIIAATAHSINVVVAGTSLMGFGAGAQTLGSACVSELVPKKSRGTALACFSCAAILGGVFGAAIAFSIVQATSWRWTFGVGAIINGVGFVLIGIFYYPPTFALLHPEGKTKWQQFKELDFVAVGLLTTGLTLFLLGVTWGQIYGWTSAQTLAPLVIGAIIWIILLPLWEVILCPNKIEKLLPPELFRNLRTFTIPLITIFVTGMLFFSLQSLWPAELQYLFTTNNNLLKWYAMALGGGSTLGAVIGGMLFGRIKHTKWQFTASIILQTAFIGAMSSVTPETLGRAISFVAIAGFGIGYSQSVGVLTVQLGAKNSQIGTATAVAGTVRGVGGSIAIAVYNAVLAGHVKNAYAPTVAAATIKAGLSPSNLQAFLVAFSSGNTTALAAVPGVTSDVIAAAAYAAKMVYSGGFKLTYEVAIAFGGVAVVAALLSRSVDDQLTSEVAVTLDKPRLVGSGNGEATVTELEHPLKGV